MGVHGNVCACAYDVYVRTVARVLRSNICMHVWLFWMHWSVCLYPHDCLFHVYVRIVCVHAYVSWRDRISFPFMCACVCVGACMRVYKCVHVGFLAINCTQRTDLCRSQTWNLQPTNQPTNWPINQSINQSINQPINQPTNQSTHQSTNQSINQSMNQLINPSTNWSTHQPINQPINQSINQPINQSTTQPINQSTN